MLYQNSRGQTIGGLSSMATSITISRAPAHAFQFRLATLLIATVWAALVSLGLRTPTPFWSGVIAVLTLLVVMFAVLLVIYRIGRTRAMAIGFLVFCVGYLIYLAVLAGTLSAGLSSNSTPVGGAFQNVFQSIHPPITVQVGGFGGAMGGFGGEPAYVVTMVKSVAIVQRYDSHDFVAICNHALACMLGVVGSVAAQVLFASQTSDRSGDKVTG